MNGIPMDLAGEGFYLQVLADSRQPPAEIREELVLEVLEVYRQCEDFLALGPVPTASRAMVLADFAISREECGIFCAIRFVSVQPVPMPGIVDFVPTGFEGSPQAGYLSLLMIGAPYRSAGLGEKVVRLVERAAQSAGAEVMFLGVQVNNPGAIRFYRRQGYIQCSEARDLPDGTRAMMMKKELGVKNHP